MSPPHRNRTADERRSTAVARAAAHRNAAPQAPHRTASTAPHRKHRSPLTAAPTAVAVTALAAGVGLHHTAPPLLAFIGVVVVAVAAVAVVGRSRLSTADQGRAQIAVLATAAIVAAAATAPLTLRLTVIAIGLAVLATAAINRDPRVRRRNRIDEITAAWPATAEEVGVPGFTLNGPIVDRAPTGYTIRVAAPHGQTADVLRNRAAQLSRPLRVPVSAIQVEVDDEWPALASIHIRETDPADSATADISDPQISSGGDLLPLGPYDDAQPYNLQIFVPDVGGVDTLLAGDKGAGKSSALIRILKLLVRAVPDITLIGWDGANGKDLGPWAGCFFRYTTEPREVLRQSKILEKIVDRREQNIGENRWRVWRPSPQHPLIVVPVDEMAKFGESVYGVEIAEVLGRIAKRNRAVGVIFIGATQYAAGLSGLGSDLLRGMHNRLQFRDGEGRFNILSTPSRRPIALGDHGRFYGESYGENRPIPARVLWTPDDERDAIIAEWAGRQTRIDDEWAAAEQALDAGNPPPAQPKEQPAAAEPPAVSDSTVTEGEVLIVQDVMFPPVRDLPKRRPELEFADADRAFKDLLRTQGQATHGEVEELTGWRRSRVRKFLIVPAMEAGWLDFTDVDGTRVYRPVREWLDAERGE